MLCRRPSELEDLAAAGIFPTRTDSARRRRAGQNRRPNATMLKNCPIVRTDLIKLLLLLFFMLRVFLVFSCFGLS